jgi:hypothetical protein
VPICLSRTWPWLCLSVLIFAVLASQQGSDANWDFRNYHLYNGEAVLGSRHGDIAVAQEQTYLNPALDIAYALLRRALSGSPALLLAAMAVPQGIAAFLAWRIAVTVIPDVVPYRKLLAALAVLFGATGAAGLPTLGTTMTEMVPACFMLSGLLVLMDRQPGARWRIAGAGLLFGAAVGLKLVIAPTLLGASAALLLTPDRTLRQRGKELVFFGAGGAAGLLLVAGPWWLDMYQHYGNPLFPYYNDVFRSPWVLPERLTDNRFKPKDWLHAVFYSFYWGAHEWAKVTEVRMRDPRFSMAYVAVIGLMALAALRRLGSPSALLPASNRAVFLAIFFAASFLVWEALFSIFRYLAPIGLLTGTVVLLPRFGSIAAHQACSPRGVGRAVRRGRGMDGLPAMGAYHRAGRRGASRAAAAGGRQYGHTAGPCPDGLPCGLRAPHCAFRRRKQQYRKTWANHAAGPADRDRDPHAYWPAMGR